MKRIERETIINFNMEEASAWIGTRIESFKNKLKKLGIQPVSQQGDYECFVVPKNWIKVRPPRKMTAKQRKGSSERMTKYNALIKE